MTPREIADFVGRELSKGRRKGEIAASIGKSAAFVSQHAALLRLPEALNEAFSTGRVNDVTLINELVKCYREAPDHVARLLTDVTQDITRRTVTLLRDFLKHQAGSVPPADELDIDMALDEEPADEPSPAAPRTRQAIAVVQV